MDARRLEEAVIAVKSKAESLGTGGSARYLGRLRPDAFKSTREDQSSKDIIAYTFVRCARPEDKFRNAFAYLPPQVSQHWWSWRRAQRQQSVLCELMQKYDG